MHLRQPRFTYSASGPFTKNKERIQRFKEAGDSQYIYQNEFDKLCFQHDMAYGDFKDLTRRTNFDKILREKAFRFPKNPKYYAYQRNLASMVYTFFDRKIFACAVTYKNMTNQELAEELQKPIIRKFEKRKAYSFFIDNIWGTDLADMQLISKSNERICFLLCFIDISSKYTWVIRLKDKEGITITSAFQKLLAESNRKPNKVWVDKGSEFYNRSMKSWLDRNAIEMYTTYNEGKSVAGKRFVRTLKN